MKDCDNEHVLRCLDSALRVFRESPDRATVAEIKIQSLLGVIRRTVAHQRASDSPAREPAEPNPRSTQRSTEPF